MFSARPASELSQARWAVFTKSAEEPLLVCHKHDALNHLASRCFKDVLVLTRQLRVLGQEMPDGGSEGFKTSFQPFRINASDDDEIPF
jgi:hypothetical protein